MKKAIRIYDDDFDEDELSEEELDELYRPKKQNSRKHSLPLFVYLIIRQYSSSNRRLSQAQIVRLLESRFELTVERKAISRTIHDLEDENIGIHSLRTGGVWYE